MKRRPAEFAKALQDITHAEFVAVIGALIYVGLEVHANIKALIISKFSRYTFWQVNNRFQPIYAIQEKLWPIPE